MERPGGRQAFARHQAPESNRSLDGNNVTFSSAIPLSQIQLGNMLITQSQDRIVRHFQGQIRTQPQGQITTQPQGQITMQSQGQIVRHFQGQIRAQPQGQITMQPQGQITMQPQGQITMQSQGQVRNQPQGQIAMRSQGQIRTQTQGQITMQSQGQIGTQPQGQITMQSQGQIITQPQGQITIQSQGQIGTQPQGQITMQSQGQIITQPRGQISMQSQGQIKTQPQGQLLMQSQGQIVNRPNINPGHCFGENQYVHANPYASRFNLQPVTRGIQISQSAAEPVPSPLIQPSYKSVFDADMPTGNCIAGNVVPMQTSQHTARYSNNQQNLSSNSSGSANLSATTAYHLNYKEQSPASMNFHQNLTSKTNNSVDERTNKSLSGQQGQYSAEKEQAKRLNAHDARPVVDSNTQALVHLHPHSTIYQQQSSTPPLQKSSQQSVADNLGYTQQYVNQIPSGQQGSSHTVVKSHVQTHHPTATTSEQQSLTTITALMAQGNVSPSAVECNPKIPAASSADDYHQKRSIHRSSASSGEGYCEPCGKTFDIKSIDAGHPFASLFTAAVTLGDFVAVDFQSWQNWSALLNMNNVVKMKSRGPSLYECLMCMQETSKPAFFHFHIYKHLVSALPLKCSHCVKKEYASLKTVVDNLFYFLTKVLLKHKIPENQTKGVNTELGSPGMSYLKVLRKMYAQKSNALNEDCEVGSSSQVQKEDACQPSTTAQNQLCEPDTTSDVRSLGTETGIPDTTSTSIGYKDDVLAETSRIPDKMVAKTVPEHSDVAESFLMDKGVDRRNTDTPSLPVSGEKHANLSDNTKRGPLFDDKLVKELHFGFANIATSDNLYSASKEEVTNSTINSISSTKPDRLITADQVDVNAEPASADVADCSHVDKDVDSRNTDAFTVQVSDMSQEKCANLPLPDNVKLEPLFEGDLAQQRTIGNVNSIKSDILDSLSNLVPTNTINDFESSGTPKSDTPTSRNEDVLTNSASLSPPIINAHSQAETEETLDAIARSMLKDMYGVNVDDELVQIVNAEQALPIVGDTNTSKVLPNECPKSVSPMLPVDEHEGWFYACGFPQCYFSYAYLSQLRTHFISSHSKEVKYPCIYCRQLCASAEFLLRHIHVHANKTMFLLYLCTTKSCKFGSNKLSELEDHLQTFHASDASFRCKKCFSKFPIIADLISHLQKNVLKFVQCPYCGAKHKKRSVILEHIRVDHPNQSRHVTVTSQLLCQKSGSSNQNKNCSLSELSTNSDEWFKDSSKKDTNSHGRGHNTKVLHSTNDAKRKKRKRENDKDDLCKENSRKRHKAFASRSDQEKIFKNLDISLLPCYIATSSGDLRCLVCDLEDSWKHRLLTHIMVKHLGVLLYACPHCGYEDLMYSGTRDHIKTVHKGKSVKVEMVYPENIRDIAVNFMSTYKYMSSQTDLTTGHPIVPGSHLENGASILIEHRRDKNSKIVKKKLRREQNHLDSSLKPCYVSLSDQKYKCKLCNLIDSWKHRLHNHIMKRHLGIKLFQCSYCGFKDGAYTNTMNHISRVHRGKKIRVRKVIPADLHSTAVSFVSALKHIDERATDSSPRLSRKKTETIQSGALNIENISKSQNDPFDVALRPCLKEMPNGRFKCVICGSEKRKKERLHRHIIVKHLGLLMYPCPYCQYADITEETARAHIIKQHNNKPLNVVKSYPDNLGEIVETFMAAFRRMNTGSKNESCIANAIDLTMNEYASPDVRDNQGKGKCKFRLTNEETSSADMVSQEPECEDAVSLHEDSQLVARQSEHGRDAFMPKIVVKKGKIRPDVYEQCQPESRKQKVRPRLDKRKSTVGSTEQHSSSKLNECSRKSKKERKLPGLRYCCNVCDYRSINLNKYRRHLSSHSMIARKEQDVLDKYDNRSSKRQYACVHCMFLGPSLKSLHLHCKHIHPGKIVAMRQIALPVDKECTPVNLVPLLKITDLATMDKCKQERLLFDCHVKHIDLSLLPYQKFRAWISIFSDV